MAETKKYPLKNTESLFGDLTYLQSKGIQRKRVNRDTQIDGKEYEILSSKSSNLVIMTDSKKEDIIFPYKTKVKLVNPRYEPSVATITNGAYILHRVWVDDIVEVK